ncbi:serine protease [Amylibacter kogurei]|uniref:Probable periplasmic serine endoprotease DegP-like n=1 Tax=Paramylibacter kogurei TaxID=1889778 RepID=A0A2G5K4L2_9RHOB|nr:serine protease [Amylibacter kogurei]
MKSIAITRSDTTDHRQTYLIGAVLTLALLMAQTLVAHARGAPDSFADLAERLSPSVVNITTTTTVTQRADQPMMPQVPEGSPFRELFPDLFGGPDGQAPSRKASALGSGFVISADGFIVTNNHVIDKADEIIIEFFDGKELEATLVGRDEKTDVAVLKVEASEPLPFVTFGDSDVSRVGDWVMAIGNPLGQGFTVTSGIISARNRSLRGTYDDYIQTDAAINRGNSGGPLFNMDGNVVGVNTAIISPTGGSIGLGFAMSSNVVSKVVAQLQEFGETRRGWLGVRIQDVDAEMADALGLDKVAGALVSDVPEGPATEAGILAGDVILQFDGKDIEDTRELVRIVGNSGVGDTVRMLIYRDGKTQTVKVVLGRREDAERGQVVPASADATDTPEESEKLGMTLTAITPELRERLKLDNNAKGVAVISVDETKDAFDKGIRSGDIIAEVGQTPVSTPTELSDMFKQARDSGRKSVLLLVQRDGNPRFVALSLEE